MCDCIKDINDKLKASGQCLDATMFGVRKATTMLIRTDKWKHENRRSMPTRMIASFCPFCGENYKEALRQAPNRRCDTNVVDGDGSCLVCDAAQGERCLAPKSEAA